MMYGHRICTFLGGAAYLEACQARHAAALPTLQSLLLFSRSWSSNVPSVINEPAQTLADVVRDHLPPEQVARTEAVISQFFDTEEHDPVPVEKQKILHVGVIGAPNAGKSTLTNALAGCKVSAVSQKTNTTLYPTLGAFTVDRAQVILHDTPGVVGRQHYRNHKHGERVHSAWATASTCDLLLLVVDAARQAQRPDPRVHRLVENLVMLGQGTAEKRRKMSEEVQQLASLRKDVEALDVGGRLLLADGRTEDILEALPGSEAQALSEKAAAVEAALEGGDGVVQDHALAEERRVRKARQRMTLKRLSDLEVTEGKEGDQQLTVRETTLQPRKESKGTLMQQTCPPVFLVMNKMDALKGPVRKLALYQAHKMAQVHKFEEVFYISAKKVKYDIAFSPVAGLTELKELLVARARKGRWLLAAGQATDLSPSDLVLELVREKLYVYLHQELPYTTEVVHVSWKFKLNGGMFCEQHILVRNDRQRGMVLGKGGETIERITTAARIEAEKVLGCSLELMLKVRVEDKEQEVYEALVQELAGL